MEAIIGITAGFDSGLAAYRLKQGYIRSIIKARGSPVILPATFSRRVIRDYVNICNGFVFSGGGDVDPYWWGGEPQPGLGEIDPKRDYFEMELAREVIKMDKPGLFICRGMQLLNVLLGGTLIQDIKTCVSHMQKAPSHHPYHDILVKKESLLGSLAGLEVVRVNSFHHQAVETLGYGLETVAQARDGVIEAVEMGEKKFILGVQWHPETMHHPLSFRIFKELVAEAAKRSRGGKKENDMA